MKRKTIAVLLALALMLSMSMTALADSSTTATVPVTLTVDNEYRAVNITVPASLPIHIINGTVVVADSAKIVNNSKMSAVRVAGITVADGAYKVGSYDSFSGSQTLALKINGCPTTGPGELTINATAFPDLAPGGVLPLTYYAKISGDAKNVESLEAASVIITFAFVD